MVRVIFGDAIGGSGWEVQKPDGSTEMVYFTLPEELGITTVLEFENPPTEHLGRSIKDTSVVAIGTLYVEYLTGLVERAFARFKTSE
jgi:hypothetical protein